MHPISPRTRLASLAGAVLGAGLLTLPLLDGTEQLQPSTLAFQQGTGLVVGGVGLVNGQPGGFNIEIPAGSAIRQVVAYWEGQGLSAAEMTATDTVMVNGNPVTGDRIGGPTNFFWDIHTATYRADVTSLPLVNVGMNTITVSGLSGTTTPRSSLPPTITETKENGEVIIWDYTNPNFANYRHKMMRTH